MIVRLGLIVNAWMLVSHAHAADAPLPTTEIGGPEEWLRQPEGSSGTLAGGATHGVEEFRFRFYQSQDDLPLFPGNPVLDYQEVVERLIVIGGNEKLSLGIQGDAVMLYSNAYRLDGNLTWERDLAGPGLWSPTHDLWFGIEKIWMESRGKHAVIDVGDTYAAFGRGLALNLVKNSEIDVDTSLRGLKGVVTAGNVEVTVLTAVTNPQQVRLENPNVAMAADLPSAVSGIDVEYYGRLNLGAHGVLYQFARELDPTGNVLGAWENDVDAGVLGANLKANGVGPGLDFGVEADWFHYAAPEMALANGDLREGYALYASMAAYPGVASILVEGKWYKDTEYLNIFTGTEGFEVAAGPSLEYERTITEDSSAGLNSNDIKGARARVDVSLMPGGNFVTPYVSVAAFRDDDLGGVHFNTVPETIVHPVAGWTLAAGETHATVNLGYRADFRDDAPASNAGDTTLHGDVSLSFPIVGTVSGEVAPSLLRYHWGVNPVQQVDYTEFSAALAIKVGTPWAFIAYADFTDNDLIRSHGNVTDEWYGGGEVQWTPVPSTTLKAFYGAYRAGIRCAGGQCRSLPGFEGAKLALTTNF